MDWRYLLILIVSQWYSIVNGIDQTLEPKGNGTELITSVTRKIQDSCVFPNDFQFLRRVAFVESKFGDDLKWDSPKGKAGIWQINEKEFSKDQNSTIVQEVKNLFKVDLSKLSLDKGDFTVPLYGGLAARSLMAKKNPDIPLDLNAQAKYWIDNYNPKGSAQKFLDEVKRIPNICKAQGADILFLLDSSGSIGADQFDNVKTLMTSIVSNNRIRIGEGDYKIAIDLFSTEAQRFVAFNSYTTKDQLLAFIPKIPFLNQGTNMHKAFKLATESFNFARDRSRGLPRVIVFITDGQPDKDTGPPLEPAGKLKQDGVEIFTIGVGTGIDKILLEKLASEPTCMHTFIAKDYGALAAQFPSELEARSCQALAPLGNTGNDTNGGNISTLISKDARLYFSIPGNATGGVTIKVQTVEGVGIAYVSTSARNPSPVEYDYKVTGSVGKPGELHIGNATGPIYLTLEGQMEVNNVSVSVSEMDPTPEPTLPPLRVHSTLPAPVEKKPEVKPSEPKCDQKGIVTTIVRRNETLVTSTTNITTITHETITQSCDSAEKKCCGGGSSSSTEQKTISNNCGGEARPTENPADKEQHMTTPEHAESSVSSRSFGSSTPSVPFGTGAPPTPEGISEDPDGIETIITTKSHGHTTSHPVSKESSNSHRNVPTTTAASTEKNDGNANPYGGAPVATSDSIVTTKTNNHGGRVTPSPPALVTSGYQKKNLNLS